MCIHCKACNKRIQDNCLDELLELCNTCYLASRDIYNDIMNDEEDYE